MLSDRYTFNDTPIVKLNPLQLKTKAIVGDKIKSKQYKFENVPCFICGNSSEFEKLAEKDRYGLLNHTVVCKQCGFVQTNPRFTQESYHNFYKDDYRSLYDGEANATDVFFRQQYFRGTRVYDLINRFKEFNGLKTPYVFEVGCGAGGILKVFKEKGCKVKGIDLGKEYLKYGKEKHQLDLEEGTLATINTNEKPDLIIYSHVFEHLTDPIAELNAVKKFINPNGLIYIEVPGIKNIHMDYRCDFLLYLQNAHVYDFSLASLQNTFSMAGFDLQYGDEYIRSVSKVGNLSSDKNYENDYQQVSTYLQETEKKRATYAFSMRGIREQAMRTGLATAGLLGVRGILRKIRKGIS